MLTIRHVIPLLGLAAACNDDPGLGGQCVIAHHEALPEKVPVYQHAIAADGEGRVHVAGPSIHLVRAADGSWSREEEAFGVSYFGEVVLASSGSSVIVAHAGNGIRVARGEGDAWTTLFKLSSNQCSGHPYVERVEAADDGSILLASSEGMLRIREGADPESLPYAGAWAVDGAGLLTCTTGDELRITDGSGEATLPHAFERVLAMAASPRGGAAMLLSRDNEGGVWLVRRSDKGDWNTEPTQLAAWTDVECPDDPTPGAMCSSSFTRVTAADVVPAGGALIAFVVLEHGRADRIWSCEPVVGSWEHCYWTWKGEWTYEHDLWMGDLASGEPALHPVALPEAWNLREAHPVAASGADGSLHALFGSSYASIRCPK
jgi:hypothetical protein